METAWHFEDQARAKGWTRIAGVDEAGRGPLAGPVVAAAVVLPEVCVLAGVNDSKQLTRRQRERLYPAIYAEALAVGIGIVDACFIDRVNILRASLAAMAMAVANLHPPPQALLVDGQHRAPVELPQQAIVDGDARCVSIAAASIVAKETRDRLMQRYGQEYPQFGFERHQGYPTRQHRAALACHGPCAIHRRTFRGVRDLLAPTLFV